MSTQALAKTRERMPSLFTDLFNPWNEWFDGDVFGRTLNVPAVNIVKQKDEYIVSLAAPGLNKEDFKIAIDGNILTISSEKEEQKEEKESQYTRKEYNYASFSRSFTLPDDINKEKIEAKHENGVLKVTLPCASNGHKNGAQQITVQ